MLKYHLILLFLILQFVSNAQLEIRNYPIILDDYTELNYKIDYIDTKIVEKTGVHLVWDLSHINTPIYEITKIRKDKTSNKTNTYIVKNGNNTLLFNKKMRNFDEIGFIIPANRFPSRKVLYKKPLNFSTKNLIYGATFSNSTSFDITLKREEFPQALISNLPISVQNIKLIGNIKRKYHCDADGKFIFTNSNVSALRIKVNELIEIRLYDEASGNEIPIRDNKLLNKIYPNIGSNNYYIFYSNTAKYFFARINYSDIANSYIIKFQTENNQDNNYNINKINDKTFLIYPNPTYNIAKLLISNYGIGKHKLEIFNIIGKKLWSSEITLSKDNLLKYNFSFLRKGTYLIVLKDNFGKIVSTRKLIIISV